MHIKTLAALLFATGAVAACGDTTGERLVFGAAAGAGTAAVLDGNPVAGAAVGAAANVLYCQENPSKC